MAGAWGRCGVVVADSCNMIDSITDCWTNAHCSKTSMWQVVLPISLEIWFPIHTLNMSEINFHVPCELVACKDLQVCFINFYHKDPLVDIMTRGSPILSCIYWKYNSPLLSDWRDITSNYFSFLTYTNKSTCIYLYYTDLRLEIIC